MYTPLSILFLLLPVLAVASIPSTPSVQHLDERLNIGLDLGVCVALNAAFTFEAVAGPIAAGAQAEVGACICVDASAQIGVLNPGQLLGVSADVDVVVQLQAGAMLSLSGDTAREVAESIQKPGQCPSSRAKYPFNLGSTCSTPSSLIPNSVHDFSLGCCGRRCVPGYELGKNSFGQSACIPSCPANKPIRWKNSFGISICVPNCPTGQVRRPDGGCSPACPPPKVLRADGTCVTQCTGNQMSCGGVCYDKRFYTCPSGIVSPKRKRSRHECPVGKSFCPTSGSDGWECVDTQNDIESCGGCTDPSIISGPGFGTDCTAIPGTDVVSCRQGSCKIHSCQAGFAFAQNGTACAPSPEQDVVEVDSARHRQMVINKRA